MNEIYKKSLSGLIRYEKFFAKTVSTNKVFHSEMDISFKFSNSLL